MLEGVEQICFHFRYLQRKTLQARINNSCNRWGFESFIWIVKEDSFHCADCLTWHAPCNDVVSVHVLWEQHLYHQVREIPDPDTSCLSHLESSVTHISHCWQHKCVRVVSQGDFSNLPLGDGWTTHRRESSSNIYKADHFIPMPGTKKNFVCLLIFLHLVRGYNRETGTLYCFLSDYFW